MAASLSPPSRRRPRPSPVGFPALLLLVVVVLLLGCLAAAEAAGVLRQVVAGGGEGGTFFEPFNVTYDSRAVILGGKRRMLVSAGLHYPRATPEMWPSLIAKCKEGGADVIETYIFWNGHEPARGQYYFEGRFDIVKFAKLVAAEDPMLALALPLAAAALLTFGEEAIYCMQTKQQDLTYCLTGEGIQAADAMTEGEDEIENGKGIQLTVTGAGGVRPPALEPGGVRPPALVPGAWSLEGSGGRRAPVAGRSRGQRAATAARGRGAARRGRARDG